MKSKNPLAVIIGWLSLAIASDPTTGLAEDARSAPEGRLQAGTSATLSGRVYNEATGTYLEGVRVQLQGTSHQALTDQQGRYTLTASPGAGTLVVYYAGLETQYFPIQLIAGQAVTQDVGLTAKIYKLESFVVAGDREGGALAAARQRGFFNATNVAATDAFGTQTDDNVGNFLQNLPGLTAEFAGSNVREVQVRGIDADLNTVSMDGVQMANTSSTGTNRFFDFLQASSSMIESIEVTKAPTPDMPANSIGGNINMVTRSIFSRRNPRTFTYGLGLIYKPDRVGGRAESSKDWYEEPVEKLTPTFRLGFTDVLGKNKNIGLSLNYIRTTRFGGSNSVSNFYRNTTDQSIGYIYRTNMYISAAEGPHTRENTNAKLEFKLSDRSVMTVTAAYNFYIEANDTRTHNFQTGNAVARFAPGFSEYYAEALPNAATLANMTTSAYDNVFHNHRYGVAMEHRLGGLVIDYLAAFSLSTGHHDYAPFERNYRKGAPKANLTIGGLTNIGFIMDRRGNPEWPLVTQTSGPDAYDLNNYTTLQLDQNHRDSKSGILEARFNLRKDFDLAVPAHMKLGWQYQDQRRKLDFNYHRYNYTGPGRLGQFADQSSWVKTVVEGRRQGPWVDTQYVAQHKEDNPQYWPENLSYKYTQRLQNLRDFREEVMSLYWMGHVKLGNLGILGGVRVEETNTKGNGPLYQLTAAEQARRAAWVGALTPAEIERRAYAEWGQRAEGRGEYRNVFPGIHFKYDHPAGLVIRSSYTTSIGRPGLTSIIPNTNVNDEAQTVSVSNTGLRPQFADNFDLGVEYYIKPVGLISASVFLKEVSDFIYSDNSRIIDGGPNNGFDGLYDGYRLTTQANGGSARYRGFELSYQHQLRFLPGILKGLGINANYTWLETEGDYGGGRATTVVAGFRPKSGNVGLTYKLNRLDVRIRTNWTDDYLVTNSTSPGLLLYQAERITTSANITYALSNRTSLYFNWDNLFNEPHTQRYYYVADRNSQTATSWKSFAFGIQGRF